MKDMPQDVRRVMEVARAALRSKSKLKRTTALRAIDEALAPQDALDERIQQAKKVPCQADALCLVRAEEKVVQYDDLLGRRQAGDFRVEDEHPGSAS